MGDDHGGALLGDLRQGALDGGFGVVVHRSGGFIEHQHWRILEDGAGQSDALTLSAGEALPPLPHQGVVTLGQGVDEATAAVDNDTEAAIQRSLAQITQQRTTVVIAHRLSTVRHADWIVVMDQGRIVEQGSHDSLVDQGGIYTNLWQVQAGEGLIAS